MSHRFFLKEPVLSSAWLTATLWSAALFFTLASLTFAFISLSILPLSALLSGRRRFPRLIWILLLVHDAFPFVELYL
jgi:hypothetical protein